MDIELEPRDGFTFTATIEHDSDHGAPWEESDCHGPVSDWRRKNWEGYWPKAPGELLLCEDSRSALFYDFQEACRIALRDGWNTAPYDVPGETRRQRAARAARADFERLRAWCNDDWHWCGIVVTAYRNGIELGSASLWGIESDSSDYLEETARELCEEAMEQAREALASLCECSA